MTKRTVIVFVAVLLFAGVVLAQDNTTIQGEAGTDTCAIKQSFGNLNGSPPPQFDMQVWALHNRNQLYETDDRPFFRPTASTLVLQADSTGNWNDVNTAAHSKFVWLIEQLGVSGAGQFGMIVTGEIAADQVKMDRGSPNGAQGMSSDNGRNCQVTMSDVIGDCGDAGGSGRPCISSASNAGGNTTVTLTWAMPSSAGILFSRDSEDGEAYAFDHADNATALADMIRGWQIFFAHSDTTTRPTALRSNWTQTSDTEADAVSLGGFGLSTNLSATVTFADPVIPNLYSFVAVAPVFDGPQGTSSPGIVAGGGAGPKAALGNQSVTMTNVVSASAAPVPGPTPVSFSSFTATYQDIQKVQVIWRTSAEIDALGFNLYRSLDGSSWTQINASLIPAKGQGGGGAEYALSDELPRQRTYQPWRYRIEEISNSSKVVADMQTTATR